MKTMMGLLLGLTSSFAVANYNCEITEVGTVQFTKKYFDDYKLEVAGGTYSLDGELKTNIEVEEDGFLTDIIIGDRTFDYQTTTIKENDKMFTAKIKDEKKTNDLLLKIYKKSSLGVLLGRNQGTTKYKMVATFDCNDYAKEMKLIKKANIDKLKQVQFKKIPKATLKAMSAVDLPFEMGDGYYGIEKEKAFVVKLGRKVIGYIIETELTYTEDPGNVFSTNYYLANGIRFDSDTWEFY